MKADFLEIPDARGYEVNSEGIVRNAKTGHILTSKTGYIRIKNTNLKRTGLTYRKQAEAATKDSRHWVTIPGFERYEMNDRGFVRNIKTKRKLKPYKLGCEIYRLRADDDKYCNRTTKSLLWLTHGVIPERAKYRCCEVTIAKCGEVLNFKNLQQCAKFLAGREFYNPSYVKFKLIDRAEEFAGWEIEYREVRA